MQRFYCINNVPYKTLGFNVGFLAVKSTLTDNIPILSIPPIQMIYTKSKYMAFYFSDY